MVSVSENHPTDLEELLVDVSLSTQNWIRANLIQEDLGEIAPLVNHAIDFVVPGYDRALLVKLAYESMESKGDNSLLSGMAAWEIFNISLLVTDDFFDKRTSRRMGVETIANKWGGDASISLGFFLNSLAREALILGSKSSDWLLADALEVLEWATKWQYRSQFQEAQLLKKPLADVDLSMYLDLIRNATAVGMAGALELGCIMGGGSQEDRQKFRAFGFSLGSLLQIRDDLIDYIYDEELIRKGSFNDLFDKKRRLPILVAYWEGDQSQKDCIDRLFSKPNLTIDDALVVIDMITTSRVEAIIKNMVKNIEDIARLELSALPKGISIKTLSDFVDLFVDL
jgi:octaprenyl-diphosphate synthase